MTEHTPPIWNVTFVQDVTGDLQTVTLYADDEDHARERAVEVSTLPSGFRIDTVHAAKPPEDGDPEPL